MCRMDKIKAFNNIVSTRNLLIDCDIEYWLDGGTLLGAIRENGFMDSDFDIDFGVWHCSQLRDLPKKLEEIGFHTIHFKQHPSGIGEQISAIRHGVPLDIFVYYKTKAEVFRIMFDIIPGVGSKRFIPCVLPLDIFDNITQIDFMDSGEIFNIPSNSEKYLELQYGDWKVDKKPGEFKWQFDYKCMDMDYKFWDKPLGRYWFVMTNKLIPTQPNTNCKFFDNSIKNGYKLFPICINGNKEILDGNKRYWAYKNLEVPMVEVYYA